MQLQFKNSHIFFCLESIWQNIDYRFKYQINELVTANPDDDFLQTIDVPELVLIDIFNAVTVQPEGAAAFINQEMLAELIPQLQAAAGYDTPPPITDEEGNTIQPHPVPNEAMRILIGIQAIDNANRAVRTAKIAKGKAQILAP